MENWELRTYLVWIASLGCVLTFAIDYRPGTGAGMSLRAAGALFAVAYLDRGKAMAAQAALVPFSIA